MQASVYQGSLPRCSIQNARKNTSSFSSQEILSDKRSILSVWVLILPAKKVSQFCCVLCNRVVQGRRKPIILSPCLHLKPDKRGFQGKKLRRARVVRDGSASRKETGGRGGGGGSGEAEGRWRRTVEGSKVGAARHDSERRQIGGGVSSGVG
eukprot:758177-Hanusia_phi.AAC.2